MMGISRNLVPHLYERLTKLNGPGLNGADGGRSGRRARGGREFIIGQEMTAARAAESIACGRRRHRLRLGSEKEIRLGPARHDMPGSMHKKFPTFAFFTMALKAARGGSEPFNVYELLESFLTTAIKI